MEDFEKRLLWDAYQARNLGYTPQQEQALINVYKAAGSNPYEMVEDKKLAQRLGWPVDVVRENREQAIKKDVTRELGLKMLVEKSIAIEKMFTDEERAKIAWDDTPALMKIVSYAGRMVGSTLSGVTQGAGDVLRGVVELNDIAARQISRGLRAVGAGGAVDLLDSIEVPVWLDLPNSIRVTGNKLEDLANFIKPSQTGVGFVDFSQDVGAGLGNLISQVALAYVSGGAGVGAGAARVGAGAARVGSVSANASKSALVARDVIPGVVLLAQGAAQGADIAKQFPQLPEAQRDSLVLMSAFGTGFLNKIALDAVLGKYIPKNLKNKWLKRAIGPSLGFTGEGAEEFLESAWNDLVIKYYADPKHQMQWNNAMYSGGVGGTVGLLFRVFVDSALHINRRYKVHENQITEANKSVSEQGAAAILEEFSQAIDESKTYQRSPEAMEQFLHDVTQGTPLETVYITPDELIQTGFAKQAAELSPSVASQLEHAINNGSLIAVPTSEYLTTIDRNKEMARILRDHVKLHPDDLSKAQARDYIAFEKTELNEKVQSDLADEDQHVAFKLSADKVRQSIESELSRMNYFEGKANETYATVVGNYYAVQSARLGITPEQLFEKYPLKVSSGVKDAKNYKMVDPNWLPPGMEKGNSARIGEMYDDKDSVSALLLSQVDQSFAGKAKAAGLNIDHFSHSVEQSVLKHIKNQHGNAAKRRARGQIAITSQDMTRIPDIVANYDGVRFDLHDSNGLPVIGYVKKYSDGVIFYAEVMRNKRMDLSAISMKKYPATSDAIKILNNANSYVQAGGGHVPILDDSVGNDSGNIKGAFTPESLTISLLKNADLATFLHESGHLFLDLQERLAAQIQERINAGGEVSAGEKAIAGDMQVVLDWLGVKDIEQWNSLDLEQKRPYHEQFARGFESYLFEGKSPNIKMQRVFRQFRAWLLHVYKSLKSLNVSLTDEVRGVFDRMLATNQQIEEMQMYREMHNLFKSAQEAGMTKNEFVAYEGVSINASIQAIEELQTRYMKDMRWDRTINNTTLSDLRKNFKSEYKKTGERVSKEVSEIPLYRAWAWLKSERKLSSQVIRKMYKDQEGVVERLSAKKLLSTKKGVHPDLVAAQFGFSSGDELIKKIMNAPHPRSFIDAMTDKQMLDKYGEVVTPKAVKAAADRAVHSFARAEVVGIEFNALQDALGVKRMPLSVIKRSASDVVNALRVRDVKPSRYSAEQARYAKNGARAFERGDVEAAAKAKRNELFQTYAFRAAYEALDSVRDDLKYLSQFNEPNVQGLDAGYKVQIDGVLARFGLGRREVVKAGDGRLSIDDWIEGVRNQGYEPDLPSFMLDETDVRFYKDLSVEEFSRLVDGIKQIETLGRSVGKFFSDRMGKSVQEVSQELESAVLSQWREGKSGDQQAGMKVHGLEWSKQKLMSFFAAHLKPTMIMRVFDGGRDDGVFQRYLGDDAMRADSAEIEMNERASIDFGAMIDELKTEQFEGKGRFFESVGRSFNRSEVIGIALNMGNEGNRQRVLSSEGWQWEQVVPVLQSLSSGDWAVIEKVWNYVGSYVPRFRALQQRFYGVEPRWLEVSGFDIVASDGKTVHVKGGFYPVVYEAKVNGAAKELFDAQESKREVSGDFGSALVAMSFTKAQAQEHLDVPLRYDLSGVYEGVSDVIHYLAWGEFLFDADKLMRHRNVDEAIRTVYGAEFKKQMDMWLKNIANGRHISTRHGGEWVARLRQNVSAAAIGFNLVNALAQPLGVTHSISRIGARWVAEGFREFMANPVGANRVANEKSVMMRTRSLTRFREVNELKNRVVDKGQVWASVRSASYVPALVMQKWIATITWHGAYKRGIFEGLDEEVAVVRADQVVTDALGSETSRGLSAIEQAGGQWGRLFTVFYSSFNTPLNLAYVSAKTRSPAQRAADWLLLITVPVVGNMFLRELVSFGDDEDKDQGKNKDKNFSWWAKKLGSAHLSYLMNMFVGVREFSLGAEKLCGMDDVPEFYSGTSGMRVFNDVLKYSLKVEQGKFDVAMVEAAVSLLGDVTGLPAAQMNKVITGAKALAEGKTDNALVMGFGFKEGKPPEQ